MDYLLLTFAIYAPFSIVHVRLRGGLRGLTRREQILLTGVVALGVLAVVLLVTGQITV